MRTPAILFLLAPLVACDSVNLFSVEEDIELGRQVRDEILADPATYPVVDPAAAPEAYGHLRRIRDNVLASGQVEYADRFDWEVYLVDDDETLNAFAAPGGYMFFYTGLVQYLDEEDHFAGVMGHEMAHAAARHSSEQLTQRYGVATLIELALGDGTAAAVAQVAADVAALDFSRDDEAESDALSVQYLCETSYASDGTAGFFAKMEAEGGTQIPEFLSSHPSHDSRVAEITDLAEDEGCSTQLAPNTDWAAVQASMP
jgi:predicted Zn-dependent protease